ncbi:RNA polymerase sigma factor [Mucilaginibacter sp. KACC 22063]|uniref:RNA polymerase sigma factor n=1 Tax=Mucilaginibacter sp. KACC 22063 TaxID=3025666 RepID=UPI002366FEFC|nr:sigma-70 family RNA polymerase sigma factor [Mucilaginibacter sp. KACC 22063]WDF57175.1 sigma-70 family RNA polymerase sigma factor [Mucilaginibacter sp. KACC 22063]
MSTKYEFPYAEEQLVKKILGGDRYAFHLLIKHTEKLVTQLVFKMIPVAEDRKDIAQEVYLKAYSSLPNFRFQSKLSTWIGQIAYHTCLHQLEKKRPVLLETFFDDQQDDPLVQLADAGQSGENETEARLFAGELAGTITRALQQLPLIQQTIIGLYYQEELNLDEISVITCLPGGTLKSHLFRARQQLKQILLKQKQLGEL